MHVLSRVLTTLLLAVFLLLAALFAAAGSARVMERAVGLALRFGLRGTEVERFRIGSLDYDFPSTWRAGSVQAALRSGGETVEILIGEFELRDAVNLLQPGGRAAVRAAGAGIQFGTLRISGGELAAGLRREADGVAYDGSAGAAEAVQDKLTLTGLRTDFSGGATSVVFRTVDAALCGGRMTGVGRAVPADEPLYDFDLSFEGLDAAGLEQAFGGLFRDLSGRLSGDVSLAGRGGRVDYFDTAWDMPAGGALRAEVLASVSGHLPPSEQRQRLEELIRTDGRLPVESLLFTLQQDSPQQLSGLFHVRSREVNLNLNVTHEIRVDARIDALLQAWRAVFK